MLPQVECPDNNSRRRSVHSRKPKTYGVATRKHADATGEMGLTGPGLLYNHNVMERLGYASRPQDLDAVFAALADPTRRAILTRLAAGEASVNEIAAPFEMSQPAVSRHLKVLERAGLIERDVDKQRRPARLKAEPMAAAVRWLEEFKQFWSSSFDQLDGLLEELKKAKPKESRE